MFKKKSTRTLTLSRMPKPSRDGDELVECSSCSWQTLMLVFSCICFSYSRTSSKAISAKAGGGEGQKPWTSSVRNTEGGVWWCHSVRIQGQRSSRKNEPGGFSVLVNQCIRWEDVKPKGRESVRGKKTDLQIWRERRKTGSRKGESGKEMAILKRCIFYHPRRFKAEEIKGNIPRQTPEPWNVFRDKLKILSHAEETKR